MSAVTWELPDTYVDRAPERRPGRPRLTLVPTGVEVPARPLGALRITRTGRLAITFAVAVAVVSTALWSLLGPSADTHSVTVGAGQTLSQIAAQQMPDVPVRQAVTQIVLANHLSTDQVNAGQVLEVPSR